MANFQQPESGGEPLPNAGNIPAGMSAKGVARRRFAKAGAGASAGAILTLASQPAMATVCMAPSKVCSGNHSPKTVKLACAGVSPGYWKTHHWAWKGALTDGTSLFRFTFPTSGHCSALSGYKCFDIVDPTKVANGADQNNVAMHIMATLLNVRSKRIDFLTENQVLGIWNAYARDGYYQPTVNVKWYGPEIVNYLKSTMT